LTLLREVEVEFGYGKTAPQAHNKALIAEQNHYLRRKKSGGLEDCGVLGGDSSAGSNLGIEVLVVEEVKMPRQQFRLIDARSGNYF
jgi:hypothetical protein